ncbi:MAG: flagellar hook-associated protein FlgK [Gemmatimonadota bacterium]
MPGTISGLLSVARSGLLASQRSVEVASNNIANANTPGYSRQRADLVTGQPVQLATIQLGTGVRVLDVDRVRDGLLDIAYRDATSVGSGHGQRLFVLEGIEAALAEPGTNGLGASLDRFWSSWNDLANDPTSTAARLAVRVAGQDVSSTFQRLSGSIDEARGSATLRLNGMVDELNQLTAQIGDLNTRILAAESSGGTAAVLRDSLDNAIDRIATISGVQVVQRSDGTAAVHLNGSALVDGGVARALSVTSGPPLGLALPGGTPVTPPASGALGSLLHAVNVELPGLQADLDAMAAAVVSAVNTVHQTGTNPNGNTGVDFFDPAGVTARTIGLSAAVLGDVQEIAAGTPDGTGLYQAGQNDVALALAAVRDQAQAGLGGISVTEAYGNYVSDIGARVASTRTGQAAQESLQLQADIRRSEVSGVSLDEEMVDLVRFQAAYQASARMVTVADEMIGTLLQMV